jgi:hypothetical protein
MAFMSVRQTGVGSDSSAKLADTLAKAFFGDPETELNLALKRQELESEAWRRRVWEAQELNARAAAEYEAARTATEEYQRGAKQEAADIIAEQQAGLLEPPVPVEVPPTPIPVPTPRPQAAMPVPVEPLDLTDPMAAATQLGGAVAARQLPPPMPVPVDPNAAIMPQATGATAEQLGTAIPPQAPQVLPGPQPDIPVTPEQQAAYERDVASIKARVKAAMAMGTSATDIAKGMGISEGMVRMLSEEPEQRVTGETLYTGKAPEPGAKGKVAAELRKDITRLPAYTDFADIQGVYKSMLKSAQLNTKAAFMDMVYGIATLEDPGSVVREQDALMVKRTGGLSGDVKSILSYFTETGELTEEMKKNIMQIAANRYGGYKDAFNQQMKQYRGIAEREGLDLRDVLPEFEELEVYQTQLPQGITEDMVTRVMTANPTFSRDEAIKLIVDRLTRRGQ